MLCWQALLHQLQQADAPTTLRLLYWRELRPLTYVLADHERILAAALGTYQQRTSIVVATDRRCLVLAERPQQPAVAALPYTTICAVAWTAEFVYGSLTLTRPWGDASISHICPGVFAERIAWHIDQRRSA